MGQRSAAIQPRNCSFSRQRLCFSFDMSEINQKCSVFQHNTALLVCGWWGCVETSKGVHTSHTGEGFVFGFFVFLLDFICVDEVVFFFRLIGGRTPEGAMQFARYKLRLKLQQLLLLHNVSTLAQSEVTGVCTDWEWGGTSTMSPQTVLTQHS